MFTVRRDSGIYLFAVETLVWRKEIISIQTHLKKWENKRLFSCNQCVQGLGRGKYLQSC